MYIAFTLKDRQFVAAMSEVQEVIALPKKATDSHTHRATTLAPADKTLSEIPGTCDWVAGMISLHGRPVPLIDLAIYCGFPKSRNAENKWVLILKSDKILCGLIVDSVQGVRQFGMEYYSDSIPETLPKPLHCCMAGSYQNQREYLVFSFKAFIESENFFKTAPIDQVI